MSFNEKKIRKKLRIIEKLLIKRKNKKAEEFLESMIKIYPNISIFRLLNGITKQRLNKYDEAIKSFNFALDLNITSEEAWGLLTLTYLDLNKIRKEKKIIEEAERTNPSNKKIQFYSRTLIRFYFSLISI